MTEADTRAVLIDPALNRAGWTRSKVTREHYYRPDWAYTAGKVVLRGERAEREKPKRVDYLLRYTESFPIAVHLNNFLSCYSHDSAACATPGLRLPPFLSFLRIQLFAR